MLATTCALSAGCGEMDTSTITVNVSKGTILGVHFDGKVCSRTVNGRQGFGLEIHSDQCRSCSAAGIIVIQTADDDAVRGWMGLLLGTDNRQCQSGPDEDDECRDGDLNLLHDDCLAVCCDRD